MIQRVAKVILALTACGVLGTAPALAVTVTSTQVEKLNESFDDDNGPCQDELYHTVVEGHSLFHLTYRTDADGNFLPPFRVTEVNHGQVTTVPLDGTGPSFTGRFNTVDVFTMRSMKHGDVIAQTATVLNRFSAVGSDGSEVLMTLHSHVTVNANGEASVEFERVSSSC